ncbi:hypothetical protein [Thioalkalivibrio sulfidiphilus]|uniref:Uncharacterized protein n=1 Tax=Thioalkalivibrio sulfidiphilus (strain HL-EbGR7) TaxID=396588 RepID=B8GPY2_THISH|nr:hypothetical protein [Thioalkalivibrio sulfidiphilus]ACL74129.1 hypothetical protein Tgr7_3060 [Thioalkalivibrio sulfidiphilus HL-EbGr7]
MTDSKHSDLLAGPRVARWTCPSCGDAVPRLLPNGARNAQSVAELELFLEDADIESEVNREPGTAADEICLACADAVRELVGTLIRPPGEDGDARNSPGLNDTGIVGAALPRGDGTHVLIFHVIDGVLRLTETERLTRFDPMRLTYPGSRGAMAPRIWELYARHLAQLQARYGEEPQNR